MKKTVVYLLLIGILLIFHVNNLLAQEETNEENPFRCATDSIYDMLVQKDPQVALNRAKLNDFVRNYIKQNPKRSDDQVYIIPIVFHVIHTYGVENVSNEYLQGVVNQLNLDFRKMRSDTASIKDEFKSIAADAKIEFRMARKDPNGNCTMGVTRTYSPLTKNGGEIVKFLEGAESWDNSKYLNVWVVVNPGQGAAGWAYYPGTGGDDVDGIILMYDYLNVALTHEIGHYLNLPHPWGSTNDPGLASNCDIDDGIEDTPNTIGHTSCNLNAVTCGSLDNVQNFMEYSYCYRMFTNGQAAVMRATLNSDVSYRNNLWTSENLTATGTNEDYVEEECAPIADFNQSERNLCEGATVTYNDFTYNTSSVDYRLWNMEGGTPATSTDENPTITYNEKGVFDAELYVENSTDGSTLTKENAVRVYSKSDGYELPYTEHFESFTFPNISGNANNDFYVENYNPNPEDNSGSWWMPGNESWMQVNNGVSGKAIRIRNSRVANKKNKIYLPNIKIDRHDADLEISFKVAAARKSDDSYTDELCFYYSTSCGDTLRLGHSFSGSRMITAIESRPSDYIPSADEWKTHTFTVKASTFKGENFRLIIESSNTFGNTIYIDDLTYSFLEQEDAVDEVNDLNLSVFPNPFCDNLYIQVSEDDEIYKVEIYDIMGRILRSVDIVDEQTNIGYAFENEVRGVYFVKLYGKNNCKTVKVVKEN